MPRPSSWLPALLLVLGCGVDRPAVAPDARVPLDPWLRTQERDVDLLFVVDNSNLSLPELQQNLVKAFPQLLEALRDPRFGRALPDGPACTQSDRRNCRIPNLRVGVVSTDLGAGSYSLPSCEVAGGDGGRLQNAPRVPSCAPPKDAWIAYVDGLTNVPDASTRDGIEQVERAFACIAQLGTGGCGFEHPLEAARRALDPTLNVNPGFIRKDAILAIVWVTDEDDCSAKKLQLFDPAQQGLSDPLGPLTSFRCTEFGISCDKNGRQPGVRHKCQPGFEWLHKVEEYAGFFARLKPPGRVVPLTLAGPVEPFEVGTESDGRPLLLPSCKSASGGAAVPGVRLAALTNALQPGLFNEGVTDGTPPERVEVSVCSSDYGPAFRLLAQQLLAQLPSTCVPPPLTPREHLICRSGDVVGTDPAGQPVICARSCLEQADCVVKETTGSGPGLQTSTIKRCPAALFDPAITDCGADCPCWRVVPDAACGSRPWSSPYAVKILREVGALEGTMQFTCTAAALKWGSTSLAQLPQCE